MIPGDRVIIWLPELVTRDRSLTSHTADSLGRSLEIKGWWPGLVAADCESGYYFYSVSGHGPRVCIFSLSAFIIKVTSGSQYGYCRPSHWDHIPGRRSAEGQSMLRRCFSLQGSSLTRQICLPLSSPPSFQGGWERWFLLGTVMAPKTQGLLLKEKGQTTGNFFHPFRLKKWKNKSAKKNVWKIITIILNIFFNVIII